MRLSVRLVPPVMASVWVPAGVPGVGLGLVELPMQAARVTSAAVADNDAPAPRKSRHDHCLWRHKNNMASPNISQATAVPHNGRESFGYNPGTPRLPARLPAWVLTAHRKRRRGGADGAAKHHGCGAARSQVSEV